LLDELVEIFCSYVEARMMAPSMDSSGNWQAESNMPTFYSSNQAFPRPLHFISLLRLPPSLPVVDSIVPHSTRRALA
jgi:hypothetical protein